MADEQVIREGLVVYAALFWLVALFLVALLLFAARPLFSGRPRGVAARVAILLAVTGLPAPVTLFPVGVNVGLAIILLVAGVGMWHGRARWPWFLFVFAIASSLVRDTVLTADIAHEADLWGRLFDLLTAGAAIDAETAFELLLGVIVHAALLVLVLRLGLAAVGVAAAWRARLGAAALLFLVAVLSLAVPHPVWAASTVDRIEVRKAERVLRLYEGETVVRQYRVALGGEPVGAKTRQGDHRTPEGAYVVSGRNSACRFHLSLRISYPDAADRARAVALGVPPGGDIMIHGLPNGWSWIGDQHRLVDWTDGCIAVTDAEIEEIWRLVADGTPIIIRP